MTNPVHMTQADQLAFILPKDPPDFQTRAMRARWEESRLVASCAWRATRMRASPRLRTSAAPHSFPTDRNMFRRTMAGPRPVPAGGVCTVVRNAASCME
jgi:hypothetical protein